MPDSIAHLEEEVMRRLMAGEDHHPAAITGHDPGCDYCDRGNDELEDVGMGVMVCALCRQDIDHAKRSGMFTFWELLDFVRLHAVRSRDGVPVAAGLAMSPFANLLPVTDREPWWQRFRFWYRERPWAPFDKLAAFIELVSPVRDEARYFCVDCEELHSLPRRDWDR